MNVNCNLQNQEIENECKLQFAVNVCKMWFAASVNCSLQNQEIESECKSWFTESRNWK